MGEIFNKSQRKKKANGIKSGKWGEGGVGRLDGGGGKCREWRKRQARVKPSYENMTKMQRGKGGRVTNTEKRAEW